MRIAGWVLLAPGAVAFLYQAMLWIVPRNVVDLGFFRLEVYDNQTAPLIIGAVAVALGETLLLGSRRVGEGTR